MQQPEAYIGGAAKLFDNNGDILIESTRVLFQKFMDAFAEWVARHTAK
jgi:chromate reductase